MKFIFFLSLFFLSSCLNSPKIVTGKGAIYGFLSAESHPLIKKKRLQMNDNSSYEDSDQLSWKKNLVDYQHLSELYVGLVSEHTEINTHYLEIDEHGFSMNSLALSLGDVIHIDNKTAQSQSLFMIESEGNGFQEIPVIAKAGAVDFVIKMEGFLELLSDDNEAAKVTLFSRKNLMVQRLSSGEHYQFENLDAGSYKVIFWYWRLGKIETIVDVLTEKNTRVDTILTVESVMNSAQ